MKLIPVILLLILWSVCTEAHPLHLSITNITYENGLLKISLKTFRDDWETAYFHFHSRPVDFSDPVQRNKPWLGEYLKDVFHLSTDHSENQLVIEVDTIILEGESMTLEMEVEVPGNPKSLYIYNALLTDIYPDQTNLVIFEYKNRETGIKFDVKKHDEVVLL